VSHRRLSGWEPAEVTTFEYDGDRLVRTVTVREPEFTHGERSLLLASRAIGRDVNAYGIPLSEAMDAANQFAFEAQESPVIDWAEKTARDAQDRFYAGRPKGETRNGHRWGRVKRRDG
jgi:hypothetical protein